jgi:hypothetical protein
MYSHEELVELVDMAQQTLDLSVRQLAHLRDAASRLGAEEPSRERGADPLLLTARTALACLETGDSAGARRVLAKVLPCVVPRPGPDSDPTSSSTAA